MYLTHIAKREGKLLSFLRGELALSSSLVKRMKYNHAFSVNGQCVYTNFPVKVGDLIGVCLDEATPVYPAEDAPLQILYEDDALLAVDKPAGMPVHPSHTRNTGTLANRLTSYYQRTGQACAVHPVGRLDRDTFGVVLLAKNAHVHALLCGMSKAGQIRKTYRAAVYGCPPSETGIVDAPIARSAPTGMLRCIRSDGKPARSEYRLLARRGEASLLELHPVTGRTHQLRVHCAHLGCPILGDPQYGSAESTAFSALHGIEGQQLCAVSLRFRHPMTQNPMEICSAMEISLDFPYPADV